VQCESAKKCPAKTDFRIWHDFKHVNSNAKVFAILFCAADDTDKTFPSHMGAAVPIFDVVNICLLRST